jgi:hypothetical protein
MGFSPLRRMRQSGAHFTRVCLTRYVALSGFLNLLALCFSRRLPALFHAGNAHGVPPFRAFPPPPSLDSLSGSRSLLPSTAANGSTSGPLAGGGSVASTSLFRVSPKPDALLGFHPLQGVPLSRDGAPNRLLLSWVCPRTTLSSARGCPPESCSTRELA